VTSFEDALAAEIRRAQSFANDEAQAPARVAEERATAIAARREAIATFLRRMGAAGSPGLVTVTVQRRPSASRTPHHRRFRRKRSSDNAIVREPDSAYLVPHPTPSAMGSPDGVLVVVPFWVLTDGAVIWATAGEDGHQVDIRDIVPLDEDIVGSLERAWTAAVGET
jgi:hypothetical protein